MRLMTLLYIEYNLHRNQFFTITCLSRHVFIMFLFNCCKCVVATKLKAINLEVETDLDRSRMHMRGKVVLSHILLPLGLSTKSE